MSDQVVETIPTGGTINKVVYGNETLIDLTSDTVTEDTLIEGVTAHAASGAIITGTLGLATSSKNGLMSSADKIKVDNALENGTCTLLYLTTLIIEGLNNLYAVIDSTMKWEVNNGLAFLRSGYDLAIGPIGPLDVTAAQYPAIFITYDGTTFTAHVYQWGEENDAINELTTTDISLLGNLIWYVNPDFANDNAISVGAGITYTPETSLEVDDTIVCRLEYYSQ